MSKRDFIAIAELLRIQYEGARERFMAGYTCDPEHLQVETTAKNLADYFANVNPRFDRLRFLKACGMVEA